MQLSVSSGDHVMCLCFDRINHYKLFVITVHASLAQLCVWDPLDIEARKSSDSQAALASLVMQKLLPNYKVEVVKPTSMCVLNASQVFATAQTYGYHCGPIAVRIGPLVVSDRFCSWQACVAQSLCAHIMCAYGWQLALQRANCVCE